MIRIKIDSIFDNNTKAETVRAINVENDISNAHVTAMNLLNIKIDSEGASRVAADFVLIGNISSETFRATTNENDLNEKLEHNSAYESNLRFTGDII